MGIGVSGKNAKYNRSQDDKIKNLNAPQEVVTENSDTETIESAIQSLIDKTEKQQSGNIYKDTTTAKDSKVWEIIKKVLLFIWQIILFILILALNVCS